MTWRPTLLLAALLYVAPSLPGAAESIDTALRDAARSWLQAAGSATEGAQFEFPIASAAIGTSRRGAAKGS